MGYTTVITTKGQEALAKAIAGGSLPLSRMVMSKQKGSGKVLGHETLSVNISGSEVIGTKLKISASYINTTVGTGFQVHEIGIYVNAPQEGEILFSVSASDSPDYMPAHTEHALEEEVVIYLEIGASDIVTTIKSDLFATKDDVSGLKEWAEDAFAVVGHGHDGVYAVAGHNHNSIYEPIIAKKSGFNLDKSDSVSSTSSMLLATAKAVKTAYDKAVSALNVANSKEPIISKKTGFNLDKSDSVSSTSSSILATLKAVKTAYDKAVSAYNLATSKLGATATAVNANKYKNREDLFHPDNYGKVITISSSVTLNSTHVNKVLRFTNSSNIVVTVPKNLTANGKIALIRAGAGKVTTATASGMTLNSLDSKRSIKDRFALNVLMFNSLTNADLFGSLE